ncbi:MAG: nucleotidyltransferase domain-containing protein [Candidatus Brocadiia bacterium]
MGLPEPAGAELLNAIISLIVEGAKPERIILFGSRARGTGRPDSDVDLLVVKSTSSRRELAMKIYRRLVGVGCAVDVIVVTPEDVERYRKVPHLIIEPALREGKVVYAA